MLGSLTATVGFYHGTVVASPSLASLAAFAVLVLSQVPRRDYLGPGLPVGCP
jgi:hypothetical protein